MYDNKTISMYDYFKSSVSDLSLPRVIFFNNKIDLKETFDTIHGVANYLIKEKVQVGDIVGVCLPNIPQAIFSFYGVNKVGAIANVIHPLISTKALIRIILETKTKILFLMDRFYAVHKTELDKIDCKVIVCKASEYLKGIKKAVYTKVEPKYDEKDVLFTSIIEDKTDDGKSYRTSDDRAIYLHSGGTTGEPKTVVLTNYAINYLTHTLINMTEVNGHKYLEHESVLVVLPLFHGFGLTICIHAAICLGKLVLMPNFNSKLACKLMRKHKINYLAGVPNMFLKMMMESSFKGKHLKGVKQIFCGGDKLEPAIKNKFDAILQSYGSNCEMVEGYGLTEVTTVCTMNIIGKTKEYSQGQAVDGCKIKIIDFDGNEAEPNQEGEIYVHSPAMMLEYLNDPETTNMVIETDENGVRWVKTGDIGWLDEEGYLFFKDRLKRMIKVSGFNVFPSEVEKVVSSLPEIQRACVVEGRYNDKVCVKLLIEMNKKYKYSLPIEQKIKHVIESETIKYAVPRIIEVVDKFKLTQIGKIDFKEYELKENK